MLNYVGADDNGAGQFLVGEANGFGTFQIGFEPPAVRMCRPAEFEVAPVINAGDAKRRSQRDQLLSMTTPEIQDVATSRLTRKAGSDFVDVRLPNNSLR